VYEGRGWDTVGAHARGYNYGSIGIAFIGTFSYRKPNSAALNAAKQLISCGVSMVNCISSYYITYFPTSSTSVNIIMPTQYYLWSTAFVAS